MSQIAFRLDHALAALRRTPAALDALLRSLPSEWIDTTDGPDTWSPRQVVAHLIDGERRDWPVRAHAILASDGDPPTFAPYDVARSVAEAGRQPLAALLDTFAEARAANAAWLVSRSLTEADLDRTGIHPEFGPVTLRQHLATWVAHDHGHLVQIARTLARAYRNEVGPWTAYLSVMEAR